MVSPSKTVGAFCCLTGGAGRHLREDRHEKADAQQDDECLATAALGNGQLHGITSPPPAVVESTKTDEEERQMLASLTPRKLRKVYVKSPPSGDSLVGRRSWLLRGSHTQTCAPGAGGQHLA